jgi:hypothetical protein
MRRLVFPIIVAGGLVLIGAGGASAAPGPSAGAANATPGKKVCKVTDPKLDELSGIVATKSGFIVIDDSSVGDRRRVFYLDAKCKITKSVSYSGNGPRDTEDLILSPDGKTVWIADTGDNTKVRETISLWSMPVDGSKQPVIHRLAYPAGDKHDSEALLLNGDGTPIIVTKEIGRPAGIYTPTGALRTNNLQGVPLKRVGELTAPPSTTPANELSRLGRGSIDGGAIAPGGGSVVLRTYTDALEWPVSGGDVLAAIKGKPRVTPLPDEQFGEAITYSTDGKNFFTVSDMQGQTQGAANYILSYVPATTVAAVKTAAAGGAKKGPGFFSSLSLDDITYLVAGVGVFGAILVGFGIFGIVRARKRPLDPMGANGSPDGPGPLEAQTEFVGVGGAQQAGMYGRGGGAPPPGVYGGRPAASAPPRGAAAAQRGVYGADPRAGRPGQGQQPGRSPQGRPAQGQPARPGQGQPGRPGQDQPGRPGQGQPARPGAGQPARPGAGQQAPRPGPGQQPAARPGQGGQPGQPGGRPGGGAAQPPARPGRGGAGGGGVYGAPPPQPPQGPARGGQRPSAYNGRDSGPYADVNGYRRGRDYDNPNYGRTPYSR